MAKSNKQLLVIAVQNADVHEISQEGSFITGHNQPRRIVGKAFNQVNKEWEVNTKGVSVCYHPEYIRHLKEKSLLPANAETALAAGVVWKSSDKENK
jgi:hypothetical protein